jgi:HNH endonuclease
MGKSHTSGPGEQARAAQSGVDEQFERDYPMTPNAELAERYRVSVTTISRWAAKRGLKKTRAYRSAVGRRRFERNPIPLQRGAAHWNWKGGRPWERFQDPRYLEWRKGVLERDAFRCRACGRQCKKHERGLAAHHILEWAANPAERFELSNGLTLCRDCHMRLHGLGPRLVRDPHSGA